MSTVIYPGSFDPVTLGHIDVITRSAQIFDKVIVCILNNSSKKSPLFSLDERANMLNEVIADYPNVVVETYDGLLVDFARMNNVNILIRGLREESDFACEFKMAKGNRSVALEMETLFMPTDPKYSFVSSSMAKEFASYGMSLHDFVPKQVEKKLYDKLWKKSDSHESEIVEGE